MLFLDLLGKIFLKDVEKNDFYEIHQDKTYHYKRSLSPCYLNGVYVSLRYDTCLQWLIARFKYAKERELRHLLLPFLEKTHDTYFSANGEEVIVTSIPSFFLHSLVERSNHSELLWKDFASRKWLVWKKTIWKPFPTAKQAKLERLHREKNIMGAFRVIKTCIPSVRGKTVILLDDVVSTGSTANQAALALKAAWAKKVFGLFVATGK